MVHAHAMRVDEGIAWTAREQLAVSLLDGSGTEISRLQLEGSADAVAIALPVLARAMLACRCSALILMHNHPSGDPRPSRQDIATSRTIATLARMLGARLLDHRIVADGHIFSFRAEGLI